MKKRHIVLKHFFVWLVCSLLFFFLCESLTNFLFSEVHGVETWLSVLAVGLVLIFMTLFISLVIQLLRHKSYLRQKTK